MSWAHNEWDPQYTVTDFETASIKALRQHFAQARQVGCFVHFCSVVSRARFRAVQST